MAQALFGKGSPQFDKHFDLQTSQAHSSLQELVGVVGVGIHVILIWSRNIIMHAHNVHSQRIISLHTQQTSSF